MVAPLHDGDTIAAIATAHGESGIGIVRLSGPDAKTIADRIFVPQRGSANLRSHQIRYGEVIDPQEGAAIDDVLVTFMAAPKTYTREDVVEINCHGGPLVLRRVLELVLREGAREALPGEFTKRAFCSGRIDLTQAEAVCDVIAAKTEEALRLAREQMRGRLSREVEDLRGDLLNTLVSIEAYIDFPEEDIPPPSRDAVAEVLRKSVANIEELIRACDQGEIHRTGVAVAIVGRPNVGKSSLLNQLLDRRRAIVTSIPGTTTDVIEESVNLSGVLIKLTDMAGISDPRDEVTLEGVKLAREQLGQAKVVLFVLDSSVPLDRKDRALLQEIREGGKKTLVVLNKMDLPTVLDVEQARTATGISEIVPISALRGDGMGQLKDELVSLILQNRAETGGAELIPVNVRHKRVLKGTQEALQETLEGLWRSLPWDITAIEIGRVLHLLGEVMGETTPEEVLDMIFSRFCIGK